MLEIKKYAAIDIGSNAIRLLVVNVLIEDVKNPQFKKSAFVRAPIRLGSDSFVHGVIGDENIAKMIDALKAFKLLMKVHNVERYKACATSAIREAKNGPTICDYVLKKTGIDIEIIDGKKEADMIFSADLNHITQGASSYLYVDVGGGSTEFTVFSNGDIINSKSFKMGTVRLINQKKQENKIIFKQVRQWIGENTKDLKKVSIIGSGGNINKIFKMSGKEIGKPISYDYLNAQYKILKKMSYHDKVSKLGLNLDRADVIVPATKIYLSSMKWSNATKIYIPKIGLSDGIVKSLYYNKI